jgi:methylenetetrahydrofolate--tRNA-(uracil-5-)-methyltransferase
LKEEMRRLSSLIIKAADACAVPAGGALAVDRDDFAAYITEKVLAHKNITFVSEEVTSIPQGPCVVATGPLTCDRLAQDIAAKTGAGLHFYDASAPIVSRESIDFDHAFCGDRYGKGGDDYVNCPLNKEEYTAFLHELLHAERAVLHDFEKGEIFEGCMPVEVMAARGEDTLRFGPLKPVGLKDEHGNKFYAVLQLRKENAEGSAYNLVGFQTNLKFPEQKRVFSMIPALKNADFLRYGVMHRNTYLPAPDCLNGDFSTKGNPLLFFAGQMTGVEGYVESAASGLLCAIHMHRKLAGKESVIPDNTTVLGALSAHVCTPNKDYQPMNANFGILRAPEKTIRDKKERYHYLAARALESIERYKQQLQ